jgi:large subunit ribosomal protein L19
MNEKTKGIIKPFLKKETPDIKPGDTVKVYQKIKEGKDKKERIQIFEGSVLALKHGNDISGTLTVRRTVGDVSIERIFPLHSPNIEKIEVSEKGKVRRAKLYYLRERVGKKAKIKKKI